MRLAAGLVAVAVVAGCTGGASDPAPAVFDTIDVGTLTVCGTPTPGRLVVAGGTWSGPDAEVVEDVAGRLDLDVSWTQVTFDQLVSGVALNDGRCDLGVGGVVADDSLAAVATPSEPYAPVVRLVVAADAVGDEVEPDEVTGTVGVQEAGPAADARDALGAAEVVEYPSTTDLGRALSQGQVAAALVSHAQREQLDGDLTVRSTVPVDARYVLLLPVSADESAVEAVDAALPDG